MKYAPRPGEKNLSFADIARKLGSSRQYITRRLTEMHEEHLEATDFEHEVAMKAALQWKKLSAEVDRRLKDPETLTIKELSVLISLVAKN